MTTFAEHNEVTVVNPDPIIRKCSWADSVPSPWIGRQVPRLFRERGLQEVTVIPHLILTPYPMFQRVVGSPLEHALQTGAFAADAIPFGGVA